MKNEVSLTFKALAYDRNLNGQAFHFVDILDESGRPLDSLCVSKELSKSDLSNLLEIAIRKLYDEKPYRPLGDRARELNDLFKRSWTWSEFVKRALEEAFGQKTIEANWETAAFYVMYHDGKRTEKLQETFHVDERGPLCLLSMAYEFGEKNKNNGPYRLLLDDRQTPVDPDFLSFAIQRN